MSGHFSDWLELWFHPLKAEKTSYSDISCFIRKDITVLLLAFPEVKLLGSLCMIWPCLWVCTLITNKRTVPSLQSMNGDKINAITAGCSLQFCTLPVLCRILQRAYFFQCRNYSSIPTHSGIYKFYYLCITYVYILSSVPNRREIATEQEE